MEHIFVFIGICVGFIIGAVFGWLVANHVFARELQKLNDAVANDMINLDTFLAQRSPRYREYLQSKKQ